MQEQPDFIPPSRPNLTVVTAGCLALSAFSVSISAGLVAGNPFDTVLLRGLVALAACFPVGYGFGYALEIILAEHREKLVARINERLLDIHKSSTVSQQRPNNPPEIEAA